MKINVTPSQQRLGTERTSLPPSAGKIPGINGNVDVDYFQGSKADLKALCFP